MFYSEGRTGTWTNPGSEELISPGGEWEFINVFEIHDDVYHIPNGGEVQYKQLVRPFERDVRRMMIKKWLHDTENRARVGKISLINSLPEHDDD